MRCKDDVLRNGYWTGRRCENTAKFLVNGVPVCGTHKNSRLRVVRRPDDPHVVETLEAARTLPVDTGDFR